jgi:hypothetical protein
MDLSWMSVCLLHHLLGLVGLLTCCICRPFKTRMKGITHEHSANVVEFFGSSLDECDADEVQVKKLLDQIANNDFIHGLKCDHQGCEDLWLGVTDSMHYMQVKEFSYASNSSEMALTREEFLV